MRTTILFIAALPPPVHGQSLMNKAIANRLMQETSLQVKVLDIAPSAGPGWKYHLSRAAKVLRSVLMTIVEARRCANQVTIYLVVEAGAGWLYNMVMALAARVTQAQVFIHHHSSAHTLRPSNRHKALLRLLPNTTHIALSPSMAEDISGQYGVTSSEILVCRNAFQVSETMQEIPRNGARSGRLRLGTLANLTVEKGCLQAIDLLMNLLALGMDVEMHFAGPVVDEACGNALQLAEQRFGTRIVRWGFVNSQKKYEFFASIDIFLFATSYRYEAQPLVILEALAAGCPTIATNRGYITDIIPVSDWNVGDVSDFIENATAVVKRFYDNRQELDRAGSVARSFFRAERAKSLDDLESLSNCIARL